MNLRGLRAVLTVADSGSVTEAARLLALTQPGVSRQIAALEEEVGFAIFDRRRGRLTLSRKGEAFLAHVRRSVETLEQLPRAARSIGAGIIGRVEIAATSAIVHGVLPPLVAKYVADRPGLPPAIVMRSLAQILSLGAEERFDLVLAPAPLRPPALHLVGSLEFELRLAAPGDVVPRDTGTIALATLKALPFISLDPFANYQESVERALAASSAEVHFVCETTSVLCAARMVELGVGCAFVDPFVARGIESETCQVFTITPSITHRYGIFARPGQPFSEEAQAMLSLLDEVATEHGARLAPGIDVTASTGSAAPSPESGDFRSRR